MPPEASHSQVESMVGAQSPVKAGALDEPRDIVTRTVRHAAPDTAISVHHIDVARHFSPACVCDLDSVRRPSGILFADAAFDETRSARAPLHRVERLASKSGSPAP